MDYNTLKNNEAELQNEVNGLKQELEKLKDQYKKYEDLEERLSNGEVIDQEALEESYRLADEIDDVKRNYNRKLNALNGATKQVNLVNEANMKNTDDFLTNKYTVAMTDAINEIENIKKQLENKEISEYDAEVAMAKAKASYEIAKKHYDEFLERKENEAKLMDGYAEKVIEDNKIEGIDQKYFEDVFNNPEIAQELDKNEYDNAGKIKEVEEKAKIERAKKAFEGNFEEEKTGQYVDLMDAKDLIERLRKNGMPMDEIEKFVFNQKNINKDEEKKDKELENQIFDDDKQDFDPMSRNDFNENELEEKTDEVEFDPMSRNDLEIEEPTNKNQEEQEFDPIERNTELDNLDLENDATKKAVEDLTSEKEKSPIKINKASEGLMNKIGQFTKQHKIGLIGIAASVALFIANPALGAGLGIAALGADAAKNFRDGRKA